MTSTLEDLHGVPVLVCAPDGPALSDATALDLIGEAFAYGAEVVSVPTQRCPDDFFTLASGVAGSVVQKFANYRLRLVIVGDVSAHLARSTALRDFVREANRGGQTWFLTDQAELAERLRPPATS